MSTPAATVDGGDSALLDDSRGTAGGELGMSREVDPILSWSPSASSVFSPSTPMTSATYDMKNLGEQHEHKDDDEGDIEEVVRRGSTASSYAPESLALAHRRSAPYKATPQLEFCHPAFAEFSRHKHRQRLVDHFCNVLSHLIVFREENGNPFQQLVLPLTHKSPAVMDSIYALSSAHLEYRGVETTEKSEYFHGKAIQHLARLIEEGGGKDQNELLAAIMLLVYYEVVSHCFSVQSKSIVNEW